MSFRTLAALAAATLLPMAEGAASADPPTPAQPTTISRPDLAHAYDAAMKAFDADQCDRASPLVDEVIAAPDFATLDRAQQAKAFTAAADCAWPGRDWAKVYSLLVKATAYAEAEDWAFTARVRVAYFLDRWEDVVASLELAARTRPRAISNLSLRTVYGIERGLDRHGDRALSARYLAAFDLADYRSSEPFDSASGLWLDFAADRADAGDTASVTRALRRIERPSVLMRSVVDQRFFAIVDADPQRFDIRAAAERVLSTDRRASVAHPHLIAGPTTVAADLRTLGRVEEALALLEDAEPMLHSPDVTDLKDQANWYWDERARTLRELGRLDEAAQMLAAGAAAGEHGSPNVSQVLNLADLYVWAGKPEAALDAVKQITDDHLVAPFGLAFRAQVRACAYAELGRKAEMNAELAYIRAHEGDNWSAATDGPLCAGDMDAAAGAFVRALADPKARREALVDLSEFDPAAHPTAPEQAFNDRLRLAAARPEVKAAVAQVGRTMRFHVLANYY